MNASDAIKFSSLKRISYISKPLTSSRRNNKISIHKEKVAAKCFLHSTIELLSRVARFHMSHPNLSETRQNFLCPWTLLPALMRFTMADTLHMMSLICKDLEHNTSWRIIQLNV